MRLDIPVGTPAMHLGKTQHSCSQSSLISPAVRRSELCCHPGLTDQRPSLDQSASSTVWSGRPGATSGAHTAADMVKCGPVFWKDNPVLT